MSEPMEATEFNSEQATELTKTQAAEQYLNMLAAVKKQYKPRLKRLAKSKLIDMIVELSTELTQYKEYYKSQQSEDSNE